MVLRPSQLKLKQGIYAAWDAGFQNVMAVYPTGGGKTVIFSEILKEHVGFSCVIAHRQELVSQISLSLNAAGVPHRLCCDNKVVKAIVKQHMLEHGHSAYRTEARCIVAGVDTLIRRKESWMQKVSLWVLDEGHHLLRENKWGQGVAKFPSRCRGLAVTAHPERADGAGLGREYDGLIDTLVLGPCGRDLIDQGHLSDYIIRLPEQFDFSGVPMSPTTGDLNKTKLRTAVHESPKLVGDVVQSYLQFSSGLSGVTFTTDVKEAEETTDAYNAAGVKAAVITAKTSLPDRMATVRRFKAGEIMQLVNVDIFGEGFDLPALSTVSFARPTASRNLYCQQFGRALRVAEGKDHAIILDHVGNFLRHKFPDTPRAWTLERREKRGKSEPDPNPLKRCTNAGPPPCFRPYEAFRSECPYCHKKPVPKTRTSIAHVEGDLMELDREALAKLRGAIDPPFGVGQSYPHATAERTALKRHRLQKEAQGVLRQRIATWSSTQIEAGTPFSDACRKFYHNFGLDLLSAQALNAKAAATLTERIGRGL